MGEDFDSLPDHPINVDALDHNVEPRYAISILDLPLVKQAI